MGSLKPVIIFEDDYVLVVDKPAGWVVNDAQTVTHNLIVQSWLATKNYSLAKNREFRSGIVHRLDKETSGCLVVAKDAETFYTLQDSFKKREVSKSYLALVHGEVDPRKGVVEANVGRLPWNRERFGVLSQGRDALTRYEVDSLWADSKGNFYSLVNFYPETGRTHQIRIHAKYLGHPVVADTFYAGRKTARRDRQWCPRLFLHAQAINFPHPTTRKKLQISADLPSDLRTSLSTLKRVS